MNAEEAWELFTSPRRTLRSSAGEELLARADVLALELPGELQGGGDRVQAYAWGEEDAPRVHLAHGWGGSAGQMALFVEPLLERGFRVLATDAPAHGRSPGARSEIFEFVRVLERVVGRWGALHASVGHSLGGAAAAIAARRRLPVGRLALLAATARLADEVDRFAARAGLTPGERDGLRALMERRAPDVWRETDLAAIAPGIDAPALLVHDEHDPEVAYADAERLAARWPGAELHRTSGLGHVALLRSEAVVARVADFVAAGRGD